jgi:hypothetical protein
MLSFIRAHFSGGTEYGRRFLEEKIEKPLRFRKNFSGVLGKRAF